MRRQNEFKTFTQLGTWISKDMKCDQEIKTRIVNAKKVLNIKKEITLWESRQSFTEDDS